MKDLQKESIESVRRMKTNLLQKNTKISNSK